MRPKLLLRIAAGLMFLHTIGHSFGASTWKDAPNAAVAGFPIVARLCALLSLRKAA